MDLFVAHFRLHLVFWHEQADSRAQSAEQSMLATQQRLEAQTIELEQATRELARLSQVRA